MERRGRWIELCRRYWQPRYVYGTRLGLPHADAEDAVQAFFAKLLGNRALLGRADREKGKFRTYLLTSFKYFLSDQYAKARTLRRGGQATHVALEDLHGAAAEDSPETAYDRKWALVLVERAMAVTRQEFDELGKKQWFDRLGGHLSSASSYEEVATELEKHGGGGEVLCGPHEAAVPRSLGEGGRGHGGGGERDRGGDGLSRLPFG